MTIVTAMTIVAKNKEKTCTFSGSTAGWTSAASSSSSCRQRSRTTPRPCCSRTDGSWRPRRKSAPTRVKHSNRTPLRAAACCLKSAGVTFSDVDLVAVYANESFLNGLLFWRYVNLDKADRDLAPAERLLDIRALLSDRFNALAGEDIGPKLRFIDHHVAHAQSAFAFSGTTRRWSSPSMAGATPTPVSSPLRPTAGSPGWQTSSRRIPSACSTYP